QTLPPLPASNEAYVSIWNQLDDCSVVATFPGMNPYTVAANVSMIDNRKTKESSVHLKAPTGATTWTVPIALDYKDCTPDKYQNLPKSFSVQLTTTNIIYVAISSNGVYQGKADPTKPTQGTGEFSL
ncbi:hypothetical protein OSTOST_03845, partial [Ostertagia ostertagi]